MTECQRFPFHLVADRGEVAALWAGCGHVPLEVLVEVPLRTGLVRLASPGRPSWIGHGDTWRHVPGRQVLGMLAEAPTAGSSVRLLLAERGRRRILAVLAEAEVPHAWTVTGWLGWPDVKPVGTLGARTSEALAARSNDYWALDLAARAVGLGPMDSSHAAPLPWKAGVSVVIPARGVHDVLPGVLHALAESASLLPPRTPWEAVVVDDASDPPLSLPRKLPQQIRLVRSETQLHCGGARNHGMTCSRYGLIVFCDADTHLAPDYLTEHIARHLLASNLITVSLREHVPTHLPVPDRAPDGSRDSRVIAHYTPGRLGLVSVTEPVTVHPLVQTHAFRDFGHGRLLGPIDLPFMVKGNNLALPADTARSIGFPPDFTGWGPEDVCFAAKAIARGSYVVPVLSTGVFHREHPPRSGSAARRDAELAANLDRYARRLNEHAALPWQGPKPPVAIC
ncbi:glycosyltransferase family 2 protein [Streptomyces sp. GC420]|uniref:glycosyltransferase n=1 Tax=Streptomyces sp. GC420 TaxID=2697568 RepID=UPI001414E562|nr:glycosyltransferase family A protein [Streptomyces sp. GC420]NBM14462.1 glycosyltransferase [Streptomyces sp. GC420]